MAAKRGNGDWDEAAWRRQYARETMRAARERARASSWNPKVKSYADKAEEIRVKAEAMRHTTPRAKMLAIAEDYDRLARLEESR